MVYVSPDVRVCRMEAVVWWVSLSLSHTDRNTVERVSLTVFCVDTMLETENNKTKKLVSFVMLFWGVCPKLIR